MSILIPTTGRLISFPLRFLDLAFDLLYRFAGSGPLACTDTCCASSLGTPNVTSGVGTCVCYIFTRFYDMTVTEAALAFHYGYAIGDCLFDNSTLADAFYAASTSVLNIKDNVKNLVCGLINLFTGLLFYLDILVNQGIGAFVLQIFNDVISFIQNDLVTLILSFLTQVLPPEVIAILNQLISALNCFIYVIGRLDDVMIDFVSGTPAGFGCPCCFADLQCFIDLVSDFIGCATNSHCVRRGVNVGAGTTQQNCVQNGSSIFAETCIPATPLPNEYKCCCYGNFTHTFGLNSGGVPNFDCSPIVAGPDNVDHTILFNVSGQYVGNVGTQLYNFCQAGPAYNIYSICTAIQPSNGLLKPIIYGACCMKGSNQQIEAACSIMTLANCNIFNGRWVNGTDCAGKNPSGVFIERPCVGDCQHVGLALNFAQQEDDGIPDMCQEYYDLWMNESTDSKIYMLLQNQYEQCMFSYNVTSFVNRLSVYGNIVDPLVLFHPRLMWNMFGNMTMTAAYVSSYLMSNMTMDEFVPIFLNTTNISDVPVMTYYAFGMSIHSKCIIRHDRDI